MQLRNFLSNEKLFFLIRVFNNIYIKRKSWKQKEKDRIIVCKFFALFIRNTKKEKKMRLATMTQASRQIIRSIKHY